MPRIDVVASCPVYDSFRVQQVAGMFDVPLGARASERFTVELPDEAEDWQIGLIVGPSGSGKSSVLDRAYGDRRRELAPWPRDRAVIDGFGTLPTRQIIALLTAVGLSSPPAWIKPYAALSTGERFRADLARALAAGAPGALTPGALAPEPPSAAGERRNSAPQPLVAFDEFTSVVDRSVALVCSAAVARAIRRGHLACRFVAATCHYDVAKWLEADWTLDMATGQLLRRRLRRPAIDLEIHRCRPRAWELFKRHHYLSGDLPPGVRAYLATWNGEPVTFCATLPLVGRRGHRRFTRIVTLPEYQGLGIGMRTMAAVAALHQAEGLRINVTSSHPALVAHCRRSPLWRLVGVREPRRAAASRRGSAFGHYRSAIGRAVASFEYVGATGASDERPASAENVTSDGAMEEPAAEGESRRANRMIEEQTWRATS